MSMAISIIANAFAGGNDATSIALEIHELERIVDKKRRLLADEN